MQRKAWCHHAWQTLSLNEFGQLLSDFYWWPLAAFSGPSCPWMRLQAPSLMLQAVFLLLLWATAHIWHIWHFLSKNDHQAQMDPVARPVSTSFKYTVVKLLFWLHCWYFIMKSGSCKWQRAKWFLLTFDSFWWVCFNLKLCAVWSYWPFSKRLCWYSVLPGQSMTSCIFVNWNILRLHQSSVKYLWCLDNVATQWCECDVA